MKIEINYLLTSQHYTWSVLDGPDGIDKAIGYADTLDDAFSAVKQAIKEIRMYYIDNYFQLEDE